MKFGPRVEVEEIDPRSLIAQPTGYSSGLDWQTQHSKESQRSSKPWHPRSLSTLALAGLLCITLAIAATIEVLARLSASRGGFAISTSEETMPKYAKWSYLYAPTVVAVAYGFLWSWVDIDTQRLQPWFDLSRPGGADAGFAFFLQYPREYQGGAFIKAVRKNHWPVFFSSLIMTLLVWAIIPLQGAILSMESIINSEEIPIFVESNLAPLSQQKAIMDNVDTQGKVYNTAWLQLPLPAFTTSTYALQPFYVEEHLRTRPNSTVAAETVQYWSEATCSPVQPARTSPGWSSWSFITDRDCNVTVSPFFANGSPDNSRRYGMAYYGSYSSMEYNNRLGLGGPWYWPLESESCPDVRNQFLATWEDKLFDDDDDDEVDPTSDVKITAIFCYTSYHKQKVLATLSPDTLQPIPGGIRTLSEPELLREDEFNTTVYEQFAASELDEERLRDWTAEFFRHHETFVTRMISQGLTSVLEGMAGYALAVGQLDPAEYGKAEVLNDAYETAWKQHFALTISQLFSNNSIASSPGQETENFATLERRMEAIVADRIFATVVESILVAVALLTAALIWACRSSHLHLREDPASIAYLSRILARSPDVQEAFHRGGPLSLEALSQRLRHERYKLVEPVSTSETMEQVPMLQKLSPERTPVHTSSDEDGGLSFSERIRPRALHKGVGVGFVLVTALASALLVYLNILDQSNTGITPLTNNRIISQILESYIPTVFATLVGPFWGLLNRLRCSLQPFMDMSQGQAPARVSIDAAYASLPPQFAIWRALKTKRVLLALICSATLLADVLAVSMSALFTTKPVLQNVPHAFVPSSSDSFQSSISEVWHSKHSRTNDSLVDLPFSYLAQGHLAYGLELPPWTVDDWYFRPFNLDELPFSKSYTVPTTGFGTKINCTSFAERPLGNFSREGAPTSSELDGKGYCTAAVNRFEGVKYLLQRDAATLPNVFPGPGQSFHFQSYPQSDTAVHETSSVSSCPTSLFALGWARRELRLQENDNSSGFFSGLLCYTHVEKSTFNVSVNAEGKVLSYNRTGPIVKDFPDREDANIKLSLAALQNRGFESSSWRNESSPSTTVEALLGTILNSTAHYDVNEPVPDPNKIIPALDKLFRLFFVSMLALDPEVLGKPEQRSLIEGVVSLEERRIFVEQPAFYITMVILVFNLVVAALVYSPSRALQLPRDPASLGSVLAYIADSRLPLDSNSARATYSLGTFRGKYGEMFLGIEKSEEVSTVLDKGAQKPIQTIPFRDRFSWLRRRKGYELGTMGSQNER